MLDVQRTAAAFDQALQRYAAEAEKWFDGSVGSIDRRLGRCDRVLHSARATVARLSIADSARYLRVAEQLDSDRRALEALRTDLLTGASGREDVTGPLGQRTANLLWDIDDNDNHVAYDKDWNEFGRVYQHPDDNNWYAKRNVEGQSGAVMGPFADRDAAKLWMGKNQTGFSVDDPSTEYWNADPDTRGRGDAPNRGMSRDDAQDYFDQAKGDYDQNPAMASEQAVREWADKRNPPLVPPDHGPLSGTPLTQDQVGHNQQPGAGPAPAPFNIDRSQPGPAPKRPTGPRPVGFEQMHYDQTHPEEAQSRAVAQNPGKYREVGRAPKAAGLEGSDRRWVMLEAAKFVAANRDALDDGHELATRAAHFAQVKTSTFTPQRSEAITRAFVATVTDLGQQSYTPSTVRTAAVDVSFDPQAIFL